jgi:two-component system nitrogen regulation sensor histidine kinase GlnL
MNRFKFIVNKELKILSMDRTFENIMRKYYDSSDGIRYSEIIPGIIEKNADAVNRVIEEGKSFHLNDYAVPCLCGLSRAQITIDPITDEKSGIAVAEVTIVVNPDCMFTHLINESRVLIDIGKTSAGLAHGVRSPLNAIKGAIIYLQGKYSDDPVFAEFSGIIEDEIDKLDKFVTKYLSCSMLYPDMADIDVNTLIGNLIKRLKMQPKANHINFSTIYGDIKTVKADQLQIEHALLNIINNSIESIRDCGDISVMTYMDEHGRRVTIEICDTGIGYNNKEAPYAIKEETLKNGRGYGLFLTNEIVKNLGGSLEITSKKMVGTTVKINIPAMVA